MPRILVSVLGDYLLRLIQREGIANRETLDSIRESLTTESDGMVSNLQVVQRLTGEGFTTEAALTAILAQEFGMEVVELDTLTVSSKAVEQVSREQVTKYGVFPVELRGATLELAVGDPLDLDGVDTLSHLIGLSIHPVLATPAVIERAITRVYGPDEPSGGGDEAAPSPGTAVSDEGGEVPADGEVQKLVESSDAPIQRYVDRLMREALEHRASDIHVEPLERRCRVRYRVDGVLWEVENPPRRLQAAIISRLKLMANMSIAEKRLPQDGRIRIAVAGRDIDIRASSMPTVYGESIVMRLLDKEGLKLGLAQLGLMADEEENFNQLVAMRDGILLITGPTGSGKTTTLYACLSHLNQPDRKIITVEDPVEYQVAGINQVQVKREVDMTFSAALRAILRQAPNVIMIGEIRDRETARIAMNASLTGHLVLSTLHTNDAPSAVSRLTDIGVESFLVAASLRGAMAQRLVRRICRHCAAPYTPSRGELDLVGTAGEPGESISLLRGHGCAHCKGSGYFGRTGLFEIFRVTEEIEQMIYEGAALGDLRRRAAELGMRTMREDGLRKVLQGWTTIDEVLGVTVDREED